MPRTVGRISSQSGAGRVRADRRGMLLARISLATRLKAQVERSEMVRPWLLRRSRSAPRASCSAAASRVRGERQAVMSVVSRSASQPLRFCGVPSRDGAQRSVVEVGRRRLCQVAANELGGRLDAGQARGEDVRDRTAGGLPPLRARLMRRMFIGGPPAAPSRSWHSTPRGSPCSPASARSSAVRFG